MRAAVAMTGTLTCTDTHGTPEMNKKELIDYIVTDSKRAGTVSHLTQNNVRQCLKSLTGAISAVTFNGGVVTISGLGSFYASKKKPRLWRNPKTGDMVMLPASRSVALRPSKGL